MIVDVNAVADGARSAPTSIQTRGIVDADVRLKDACLINQLLDQGVDQMRVADDGVFVITAVLGVVVVIGFVCSILVDLDDDSPTQLPKIEGDVPLRTTQKTMFNTQVEMRPQASKPAIEGVVLSQLVSGLEDLNGTLRSRIYGADGNVVKELPIRELITFLQDTQGGNMYGIVLDGVITQRLVELALMKNVRAIYGLKANPMPKRHPELIIYTKEQGRLE